MIIEIIPSLFREYFPELAEASDSDILLASKSRGVYIATKLGAIKLDKELQIRGNYLATAHKVALKLNPALARGKVTSASQGGESASFQAGPNIKSWREYDLMLTPYGNELLGIRELVPPPTTKKPRYTGKYY